MMLMFERDWPGSGWIRGSLVGVHLHPKLFGGSVVKIGTPLKAISSPTRGGVVIGILVDVLVHAQSSKIEEPAVPHQWKGFPVGSHWTWLPFKANNRSELKCTLAWDRHWWEVGLRGRFDGTLCQPYPHGGSGLGWWSRMDRPLCFSRDLIEGLFDISEDEHGWLLLFLALLLDFAGAKDDVYCPSWWSEVSLRHWSIYCKIKGVLL